MEPFTDFVTRRLEAFRDRTAMWGSHEAVELQALQLLEIESRHLYPEAYEADVRIAIDTYIRILGRETGDNRPLHEVEPGDGFGHRLFKTCQRVREKLAKRFAQGPRCTPA